MIERSPRNWDGPLNVEATPISVTVEDQTLTLAEAVSLSVFLLTHCQRWGDHQGLLPTLRQMGALQELEEAAEAAVDGMYAVIHKLEML